MKITIVFDRIRGEEKWLVHEAKKSGCTTELVDGKMLFFELTDSDAKNRFGDVVLQRCISYYRSLFLTRIMENFGARYFKDNPESAFVDAGTGRRAPSSFPAQFSHARTV